ncbi:probable sulfate transporter 3.5 [Zingiber officinale]|uniref:probable sulfate transporter 3.5 n=1 Tax=Zingiber officinale TaxID=94328 RepID=UPI001C4B264B|nr:probable sulfate transporter 3.5 [Zingiber officinale]
MPTIVGGRYELDRMEVNLRRKGSFFTSLREDLRETFLPEEPFRRRPDEAECHWSTLMLKCLVPILEWGSKYNLTKFQCDLLAGFTVAVLAVPQGISYARLAYLHPVIGLYSSFIPPLIYAIFGTSTNVAVGNTAAVSLFLASAIGAEVSPVDRPELYTHLLFTAAFFTGLFQAALGIFRLGILVEFFSHSTITGFMGGTAVIVIMQQLKGMLGLKHFTTNTDLVSIMCSIFSHRDEWRWESAALGTCLITMLLLNSHVSAKLRRLFWLPVLAPLLVVVLGGLFAYVVHAEDHGIPTVGTLNKGLNPLSVSLLKFESKYFKLLLKSAFVSGFLALSEGIAVGRSLASMKNEQIDGNKEMIAFGLMNVVGACFSCYLTTGPFSKSAVNFHAGSKTPFSNVVMSLSVMAVLLFLAPLFRYTPLVALSAIIIVAMLRLIDYEKVLRLWKVDKFDFLICIAAFFGVIVFSMTAGLLASVGLSTLRTLLYVARPSTCRLGNIAGTEMYCDGQQYPNSISYPDILILKLGSPIYFASSGYLRERIMRWIEEEETMQYLILDMGGVTSIDSDGIGMLVELHKHVERRGIKIVLTNPRIGVGEKLKVSKYVDLIGKERVFLSVKEAVDVCRDNLQQYSKEEV